MLYSQMKILLVDDVQLDRMQLAIRLKQLGHEVESAADGHAALAIYPTFEPELVLLDITMPDMSGFEVSQQIRFLYQDWVPIIFLSSHDEPMMIAKAIDAGGDDYLTKPVNKLVLTSKLLAMQRIADMRSELKRTTAKLEELNGLLQHQANEDSLTRVHNRRFIDEKLQEMIAVHGRHQFYLSLILLDVDQFKLFNDNYGHIEGDQCLYTVAQTVNHLFSRSEEFVGRYGGEEFIVILGHANFDDAAKAARRIEAAIKAMNYPHHYSFVEDYVTLSQGVLSLIPTGKEPLNMLYNLVDEALYKAKALGRNRFVQVQY